MEKKTLKDIFNDDTFGLTDSKAQSVIRNDDDRLIASFEEINSFFEKNGHEPGVKGGVQERSLYSRLKGIRDNPSKIEILTPKDRFGLLTISKKTISSIDDIFSDDSLGLLSTETDSIFNLKNVPKEVNSPDYIAKRKPLKNFVEFEELFKTCHLELASGNRKLTQFKVEHQISAGNFFVLKGILLYIENVGETWLEGGRLNGRLRVIFENGTESDMLLRSLAAELYKNGRRVTEKFENLLDGLQNISIDDQEAGFIYVLKSRSTNPEIMAIEHLYKIGFCTTTVEERIKNASFDPTFLMAPVSIVTAFRCYNLNTQKLESLLHNFFGSSCLNIKIIDATGRGVSPREWFIAPLDIIEKAVHFVKDETIVNYKYNEKTKEIENKQP